MATSTQHGSLNLVPLDSDKYRSWDRDSRKKHSSIDVKESVQRGTIQVLPCLDLSRKLNNKRVEVARLGKYFAPGSWCGCRIDFGQIWGYRRGLNSVGCSGKKQ